MARKLILILAVLQIACTATVLAADCQDAAEGDEFVVDGIKYVVYDESDKDVSVIQNDYSGDITIPATVEHQGSTYYVTAIGQKAFYGCNIGNVVLPEYLHVLEKQCFYRSTIKSIDLSPVTVLEDNCFRMAEQLETVHIGGKLHTIDDNVFQHCYSLKEITVDPNNPHFRISNGALVFKDSILVCYPQMNPAEKLVLEDGIGRIATSAFYNSIHLKEVVLPEGLTEIDAEQFGGCTSLETVNFPSSLLGIQERQFWKTNLSTAVLNEGLNYLGPHVFEGCPLTQAYLPSTIETLGQSPFGTSPYLEKIDVSPDNKQYESVDGVLFQSPSMIVQYPAGRTATAYQIPQQQTEMQMNQFEGCVYLQEVTIPETVSYIPICAFKDCISLRKVVMTSVEDIHTHAFVNCPLSYVVFPKTLKNVERDSFGSVLFYSEVEMANPTAAFLSGKTMVGAGDGRLDIAEYGDLVTFDAAGGTSSSALCVSVLGRLPCLPHASRDGAEFVGWFDKETGTMVDTHTPISGPMTAVAKWYIPATGLALDKGSVTLKAGGTETVTATVTPSEASVKQVTWRSGDEKVFTVDGTGKITAVGAGSAVLIASVEGSPYTAYCLVTVENTSSGSSNVQAIAAAVAVCAVLAVLGVVLYRRTH